MAHDDVKLEVKDRIAILTFNRPERLNALSPDMLKGAISALEAWSVDPEVGCIVVTGEGRGFCAGGDVQVMNEGVSRGAPFEEKLDRQRGSHRLSGLLYNCPKVTIAAINGPAAGAGMAISLACDFRIAKASAKMTTAFAKVGFAGDFGITWPLVRMLGEAKAKELLLLSGKLTAQDALQLGLVNKVVGDDAFDEAVHEMASGFAQGPQTAFRYMKENARLASEQDYLSMLDREAWTQLRTGETEDHKEGARAFVEKRTPKFTGR